MKKTFGCHWSAAMFLPLFVTLAGCAHGPAGNPGWGAQSDSSKDAWLGSQTHESTPVFTNSDGTTTLGTQKTTRDNGTTTIVRERKTTNDDGSIRTDRETRTIVEGTDKRVSESTTQR